MCSNIYKILSTKFPYCVSTDVDDGYNFNCSNVGINAEYNVLVRMNHERTSKGEKFTFGVVDDNKTQFLYNTVDELAIKVSDILKKRMDKDKTEKLNTVKMDIEAMRLCGFVTRNDLTYSYNKNPATGNQTIHIFGTIFQSLTVYIEPRCPGVYKTYNGDLNQAQLESFILNCKAMKDL